MLVKKYFIQFDYSLKDGVCFLTYEKSGLLRIEQSGSFCVHDDSLNSPLIVTFTAGNIWGSDCF